jgi:hypothetical protein
MDTQEMDSDDLTTPSPTAAPGKCHARTLSNPRCPEAALAPQSLARACQARVVTTTEDAIYVSGHMVYQMPLQALQTKGILPKLRWNHQKSPSCTQRTRSMYRTPASILVPHISLVTPDVPSAVWLVRLLPAKTHRRAWRRSTP